MSKVITNAKSTANPPAVAIINPESILLSCVYKQQSSFLEIPYRFGQPRHKEPVLRLPGPAGVTNRSKLKLAVILSPELTLYSEKLFPHGLSDPEMEELFQLELPGGTDTNQVNTLYDYFLLKSDKQGCMYGVFEVRKDGVAELIRQLAFNGFQTVAVLPQVVVLINRLIRDCAVNSKNYCLALLLAQRIYRVDVVDNRVECIKEQAVIDRITSAQSILSMLFDADELDEIQRHYPVVFLNWSHGCDLTGISAAHIVYSDHSDTDDQAELTVNWLRRQYDLYKPAAMA